MGKREQIYKTYQEIKKVCPDIDIYDDLMKKYKQKKKIVKEDFHHLLWRKRPKDDWKSCLSWALRRLDDIKKEIEKKEEYFEYVSSIEMVKGEQKETLKIIKSEIQRLKLIPLNWVVFAIIAE